MSEVKDFDRTVRKRRRVVTWQRGLGGRKRGAEEEEEGERVGRESVIMHAMALLRQCSCVALEFWALPVIFNGFNDRYGPFKIWMTQ